MSQSTHVAAQSHQDDDVNEAPTPSFSSVVRRWVGGSVGHVYDNGNARFVGGCAGVIRGS